MSRSQLYIFYIYNYLYLFFISPSSLSKHLSSKKGSRTSNCGNRLEFSVLTLLTNVPWLPTTDTLQSVQQQIIQLQPQLYIYRSIVTPKWFIKLVHPARLYPPSIWVPCAVILSRAMANTRYLAVRLIVCCATRESLCTAQGWAVNRPINTTIWSAIIVNNSTICTSAKLSSGWGWEWDWDPVGRGLLIIMMFVAFDCNKYNIFFLTEN